MNQTTQKMVQTIGRYFHPKVILAGLAVFTFVSLTVLWDLRQAEAGIKIYRCPGSDTMAWYLAWAALAMCSRNLWALGFAGLVSGAQTISFFRSLVFLIEASETTVPLPQQSRIDQLEMFQGVLAVLIFIFASGSFLMVLLQAGLPRLKHLYQAGKFRQQTKRPAASNL